MTKFIKKCPKCGREWSSTWNHCQKCAGGVVLEVRDSAGNLIEDKKIPREMR